MVSAFPPYFCTYDTGAGDTGAGDTGFGCFLGLQVFTRYCMLLCSI